MKTYRIEMAISDPHANEWRDCGTIKGRSPRSILQRAFCENFPRSLFHHHTHDLDSMQVFHSRNHDWPIMRLIEIG